MRPPDDAQTRITDLRRQIAADLITLRQKWDSRAQGPRRTAEGWAAQSARLRGVPTWAIGVAAGLLAGIWSALRRPKRAS